MPACNVFNVYYCVLMDFHDFSIDSITKEIGSALYLSQPKRESQTANGELLDTEEQDVREDTLNCSVSGQTRQTHTAHSAGRCKWNCPAEKSRNCAGGPRPPSHLVCCASYWASLQQSLISMAKLVSRVI